MGLRRRRPRRPIPGTQMQRRTRPPTRARCRRTRRSRVLLVVRDRCVVQVAVGDRDLLHRFGEQHVLRVDEVVARVLGDLVLIAERDRVERARELAVAAEDAAAHVDLVDTRVALPGGDAVLRRVLVSNDADAIRGTGGGAERAADALLQPVLVPVQAVAAAEARVDRALVLRVLLRDRLLEQLPEGDGEALDAVDRLRAHTQTTSSAVTTALMVATGRRIFQPKRISWSYRRRGTEARIQMKIETRTKTLSTNQSGPSGAYGPCQPAKKRVTVS